MIKTYRQVYNKCEVRTKKYYMGGKYNHLWLSTNFLMFYTWAASNGSQEIRAKVI